MLVIVCYRLKTIGEGDLTRNKITSENHSLRITERASVTLALSLYALPLKLASADAQWRVRYLALLKTPVECWHLSRRLVRKLF